MGVRSSISSILNSLEASGNLTRDPIGDPSWIGLLIVAELALLSSSVVSSLFKKESITPVLSNFPESVSGLLIIDCEN